MQIIPRFEWMRLNGIWLNGMTPCICLLIVSSRRCAKNVTLFILGYLCEYSVHALPFDIKEMSPFPTNMANRTHNQLHKTIEEEQLHKWVPGCRVTVVEMWVNSLQLLFWIRVIWKGDRSVIAHSFQSEQLFLDERSQSGPVRWRVLTNISTMEPIHQ